MSEPIKDGGLPEPLAPTHPDPATLEKESVVSVNGQPVQVATALRTDDIAGAAALKAVENERPANLGSDGRVHFLRTIDGEQSCGGCDTSWPCDRYREIEANAMHLTGQQGPQAPPLGVSHDEMAALLGISRVELDDRLSSLRAE